MFDFQMIKSNTDENCHLINIYTEQPEDTDQFPINNAETTPILMWGHSLSHICVQKSAFNPSTFCYILL